MTDKLQSILQAEGLEHLLPVFKDQGVTDSILKDLSADDLRDLGIDKIGERKRLLTAFAPIEVESEDSDEDSDEDPDDDGSELVTEQLVGFLLKNSPPLDFGQLFDQVYGDLRARNATIGSEEMLRLRTYEKLQNLVSRGLVKKTGVKYKGLASLGNTIIM